MGTEAASAVQAPPSPEGVAAQSRAWSEEARQGGAPSVGGEGEATHSGMGPPLHRCSQPPVASPARPLYGSRHPSGACERGA